MAKPASRTQLVDYCLRKLGAPVLEINVDDDQIDDLVDDAIQLFNERHFDGVERMYLKYQFTQDDIDRGSARSDSDSTNTAGIVTCFLATPINGFIAAPFAVGDKVFVEGIVNIQNLGVTRRISINYQ